MRASSYCAIAVACSMGTGAQAQLIEHRDLSSAMALTIAQTALQTCTQQGHRVSVTVLGRAGEVLVQVRGDNASPHTLETSLRKAYTSRTFRIPSGEFADRVKNEPIPGLAQVNGVITLGGALPIKVGNDVIGAVGVSGAPGGEKDEACAKAGIDKVSDHLVPDSNIPTPR